MKTFNSMEQFEVHEISNIQQGTYCHYEAVFVKLQECLIACLFCLSF